MFARIVLLAAVIAVVAHAGAPTFSLCGAGSLKNAVISTPDANWVSGTTVTFTISGDLEGEITAGSKINTVAKFLSTVVDDKSDDLCTYDGTPFKCPESSGAKSWNFVFPIPKVPFPGQLTATSDFVDASGNTIVCMELSVKL